MSTQDLLNTADRAVALPPSDVAGLELPRAIGWFERLTALARDAHLRRAAITLIEQSALSGTNFLTTVMLGRTCLQHELGLYSMGFSLVLLLMGMSSALVWMPYTIYSPHFRGARLARYTGSVTVHMGLFCLVTAAGLAVASAVTSSLGDREVSGLLLVLAVAAAAMLFRDYVRRVYLARMHVGKALVLNLSLAVLQLGGLAFLVWRGLLSSTAAFWTIAAVCGLLSAAWLVVERRRLAISWRRIGPDWRHNWRSGRWMFAATLVRLLGKDIYPWVLAAFHGASAVGVLTAASGVIFFANPLLMGAANFAAPFGSHTYAEKGAQGLRRAVWRGTIALVAVIGPFCVAVAIWGGPVVELIYGHQYAGNEAVVRAMALKLFWEAICIPVGFGLLALQRADFELKTALVQLAIMVTLGLWCVWQFGPAGVGYGAAAGYLAAVIVQWLAFRRFVRHA